MDCLVKAHIFDLQDVIDEIEKLEEEKQRFMSIINSYFDNETDIMKRHEIYSALPECALRFKLFKKMVEKTEEMNKQIIAKHGIEMDLTISGFEQSIKAIADKIQQHGEMNMQTDKPEVDVDFK